MPQWLSNFLESSSSFMPHGHCYLWIPSLLWIHVLSDTLIGLAYLGISLVLYLLVRRIRLPFSPVFIAFGLFIGLCGMTHFVAVWTVWNPDYWLAGFVKAATAAASVVTAIGLVYIRPQVEEVVHAARLSEERRIELETTHAELKALYKKVTETDALKTEFFANISHELRTPLALILGPVERMMEDANLNSDQKRQLEMVRANGKNLLKQVNDLLDVAKLEARQVQPRYTRLDLAPWFKRIASQFESAAKDRGIAYKVVAPDTISAEVDPDMLEHVFINLLSNALKFTPSGGEIRAELTGGTNQFRVQVSDTGPGISGEQHKVIFERFRQVEGGAARKYGGTGLGLAIVKDLVELHGGEVKVESEAGAGATFQVHVPVRAPASAAVEEAPHSRGATTQVALEASLEDLTRKENAELEQATPLPRSGLPTALLVEDTPEMRDFIASTLEDHYNLVTAGDGHEAMEMMEAIRPDIVITDVMMPRMSGDQLVAELRRRDDFNNVPILLLTARADEELRVKLLQTGAQDYLNKPFLPKELLARAGNLVSIKRTGDALRTTLASASNDVEELAKELTHKHQQLRTALDAASAARAEAERASEVKSHFLGLISHELRTPLTTIVMNAQLLARHLGSELTGAAKTSIERLIRSTEHLTTLIEGVLEYTRAESGRIEKHIEPVDPAALMREALETGRGQVATKEVGLEFIPPQTDQLLETDPRLLRVILNNLVSNALKFTERGMVTLRMGQRDNWRIFEVQDTGIGIPAEDIPRMLLPFEQLEPLKRKSIPGVGLGLALIKEILRVLGGELEVSSEPGAGSTFRVLIPDPSHATIRA